MNSRECGKKGFVPLCGAIGRSYGALLTLGIRTFDCDIITSGVIFYTLILSPIIDQEMLRQRSALFCKKEALSSTQYQDAFLTLSHRRIV